MKVITIIIQKIISLKLIILQHEIMQSAEKNFWFYFVYTASTLVVLVVIILTIKYLINPKEESKNHIKRKILEDEGENKY